MSRLHPNTLSRLALSILGILALVGAPLRSNLAADPAPSEEKSDATKGFAQIHGSARIDCITPDGRSAAVPSAGEKTLGAGPLLMEDDTLRCPLQEGETTFIISFPKTSLLDHFTFINENAGVRGEMKIAVSNDQLPANSPKWIDVSGKTEFISKRLFNLSMVGVEARYVKLSFQVKKGGHIAALDLVDPPAKFANR